VHIGSDLKKSRFRSDTLMDASPSVLSHIGSESTNGSTEGSKRWCTIGSSIGSSLSQLSLDTASSTLIDTSPSVPSCIGSESTNGSANLASSVSEMCKKPAVT
jgi:hypothetical protein